MVVPCILAPLLLSLATFPPHLWLVPQPPLKTSHHQTHRGSAGTQRRRRDHAGVPQTPVPYSLSSAILASQTIPFFCHLTSSINITLDVSLTAIQTFTTICSMDQNWNSFFHTSFKSFLNSGFFYPGNHKFLSFINCLKFKALLLKLIIFCKLQKCESDYDHRFKVLKSFGFLTMKNRWDLSFGLIKISLNKNYDFLLSCGVMTLLARSFSSLF